MKTTYYQVLELSEQATAAEIRQAYLRWVRLTHPDRTPDPAAHARYLLVNEAYDTLSKPELRARYDARLRTSTTVTPARTVSPFPGNAYQVLRVPYKATPAHIDQVYKRLLATLRPATADPAIRRYIAEVEHAYATLRDPVLRQRHDVHLRTYQPPKRTSPFAAQYARYGPYARWVCWAVLLFTVLLLADSVLTLDFPSEQVTDIQLRQVYGRRGAVVGEYYWVETPHASFRAYADYAIGTPLHIQRSLIFRMVRSYWTLSSTNTQVIQYSFPQTAYALPVLMGILAAIGVWPWAKTSDKRAIDAAFPAVFVALIIVYLLVKF